MEDQPLTQSHIFGFHGSFYSGGGALFPRMEVDERKRRAHFPTVSQLPRLGGGRSEKEGLPNPSDRQLPFLLEGMAKVSLCRQ